ncbi:lytic transglycosylase domain-containing protein [[Clostridium] dakarense]|uniref:lytic transglycosylase domain-containing protein n=1 Tax=Faecalimicrobium dakarense TaxID=1301100 RepID=UPI0004B42EB7|nr:lytic transglycosylase domain-containing protein [[Clostridium] dakarense]
MLDKIQGLNSISTFSNNSECKCSSNNEVFDMVMISLLKAIAKKNIISNNINENKIEILEDLQTLQTQNASRASNKIEISSKNPNVNERIEDAVNISSKKYGVDANLIKAIIKVESNFNPNTVSSAGAKGLMQLMPENIRDLGIKNPLDIEENIDGGTRHIKEYLDRYHGNVEMALMAYNGGPTRMMRRGVTSIEHIYKMPRETQNYVPKVMKYYKG